MKHYFKNLCIFLCIIILISSISSCNIVPNTGDSTAPDSVTESGSKTEAAESGDNTTEPLDSDSGDATESNTESEDDQSQSTSSETTSETKTETSSETTQIETEAVLVEDLISFVDDTRPTAKSMHDLKKDGDMAMSFTIPSGCLRKIYINLTDTYGYTPCSIEINLYKMLSDYKTTVKSEPIYTEYITSAPKLYTINFDDGDIPEGDYLVALSYVDPATKNEGDSSSNTQTDVYAKVGKDYLWYESTMPLGYAEYNLKSYINYNANRKYTFCGGIVVEHYENRVVEKQPEEDTTTDIQGGEEVENVAKVIIIGGQSNATGCSVGANLANYVSPEKYQEFVNGYSNVKIMYASGANSSGNISIGNQSTTFVDVKIGQGIYDTRFGPELGLASYLSEHFPDETFYIIKYAIGSTSLAGHWNPSNSAQSVCLQQFNALVSKGLTQLESEGLTPEIVGFLWIQGESDAKSANACQLYYGNQVMLVKNIREKYASYAPSEGIPFVDVAIMEEGMWAYAFLLNEFKMNYSLESDLNYFIDTNKEGFTCLKENNDNAHYDSYSMLRIGEICAENLKKYID